MNTRHCLAAAGIAALLGWTFTPSNAAAVAVKAKPAAAANHAHIVAELHQAKHLLDHAKHANNPHRANADREIGRAIHLLQPHHQTANTARKPAAKQVVPARKQAQKAPQAAGKNQLQHAEQLVRQALTQLHQKKGNKPNKAEKYLQQAIRQIELAMHVRK
jgi:hypothetical protein